MLVLWYVLRLMTAILTFSCHSDLPSLVSFFSSFIMKIRSSKQSDCLCMFSRDLFFSSLQNINQFLLHLRYKTLSTDADDCCRQVSILAQKADYDLTNIFSVLA